MVPRQLSGSLVLRPLCQAVRNLGGQRDERFGPEVRCDDLAERLELSAPRRLDLVVLQQTNVVVLARAPLRAALAELAARERPQPA